TSRGRPPYPRVRTSRRLFPRPRPPSSWPETTTARSSARSRSSSFGRRPAPAPGSRTSWWTRPRAVKALARRHPARSRVRRSHRRPDLAAVARGRQCPLREGRLPGPRDERLPLRADLAERALVGAYDLGGELVRGRHAALHCVGERRAPDLSESLLQAGRREPDGIEIADARKPGRGPDRLLELGRRNLGLLDPLRRLGQAQLDETGAQLAEFAAARAFLGQFAHRRDCDRLADKGSVGHRPVLRVERKPALLLPASVGAEIDPRAAPRLRRNDTFELLAVGRVRGRGLRRRRNLLLEAHSGNNSPVTESLSERNRAAQALFAPLGETYDRYARLLSFGQDPRWRSFLVERIEARPDASVLDVACGTAAVSIELV